MFSDLPNDQIDGRIADLNAAFAELTAEFDRLRTGNLGDVALIADELKPRFNAVQDRLNALSEARGGADRYAQLASIELHPRFAAIHDHVGGSLDLRTLRALAIITGKKEVGADLGDFVRSFGLDPSNTGSLNAYVGDNRDTGRRSVYDRSEEIQSGPDAFQDAINLAIDYIVSYGGSAPIRRPLSDNDIGHRREFTAAQYVELKCNPLKRTSARLVKNLKREGEKDPEYVLSGEYDLDQIFLAMFHGIDIALNRVQKGIRDFRAGAVICFGKDLSIEQNMILAERTARYAKDRPGLIVGLDMAGPEGDPERTKIFLNTPEGRLQARRIFEVAGRDLPLTLHLGETSATDLKAFKKSLEILQPRRVSHPISPILAYLQDGDATGLEAMKEFGVVAELLPRSNEVTGRVRSIEEFKEIIATLRQFGIPITVGTDAPGLQGLSFTQELLNLYVAGAATVSDLNEFIVTGLESTFLNPDRSLAR